MAFFVKGKTMTTRWTCSSAGILAILPFALFACATSSSYDPSAKESFGVIVAKDIVGTHQQATADSPNHPLAKVVPVFGLMDALHEKRTNLPLYSYRLKKLSGEEITVTTTYSADSVGSCVQIFESARPGYPRFLATTQCEP